LGASLLAQNNWAAWGTIQLFGQLYSQAFGAVMLTSKAYLQQAEECLQLANASSDVYVKEALTELASDFKAMAMDLETAERTLTRNRSSAGWKMRRHQDIAGLT
jgi:hypothetical protein